MAPPRGNIGVLRLIFASLVIIGHAPEQIDGDRHREPLTTIFHTVSLGQLSVDAFFLISGYLITMSWMRTKSLKLYLQKRALRIYPAFIVAYLISVFALGPLVGASPWRWIGETVFRLVALQSPLIYPGQLAGLHYPDLNGSMWTIAYEFRGYLLVAALGLTGLLHRRWLILCVTAIGVAALIASSFDIVRSPIDAISSHQRLNQLIGAPLSNIELMTTFLVGICFYLFKIEALRWLDARFALLAGLLTAALLFRDPHLAQAALITLGAAPLFWIGLKANLGWLQTINDRWDISYGVYLYGWPIATAIRWFDRSISPWSLAAATLTLAVLAGAASWWGVERWTKDVKRLETKTHLVR
jgi:peptidoglycan/LPS O-acetylase OafA/YrhL